MMIINCSICGFSINSPVTSEEIRTITIECMECIQKSIDDRQAIIFDLEKLERTGQPRNEGKKKS